MEYTAKDQLAQWEEGDRILREDFNRDNARTEAALADMLHRCEAIKSVSLGSTQSASLDLSDSDWGQWSLVGFTLDLRTVGSATAASSVSCSAGGAYVSQHCSHMDGFLAHAGYMPLMLIFPPFRNAAGRVQCVYFGSSSGAGRAAIPFAELTEVLISAGRAMSSQTSQFGGFGEKEASFFLFAKAVENPPAPGTGRGLSEAPSPAFEHSPINRFPPRQVLPGREAFSNEYARARYNKTILTDRRSP